MTGSHIAADGKKSVTLIFLKTEQDQRTDPFQSDIFMLELNKLGKDEAKD